MGLPTPSSSIVHESPDKHLSYASRDHTPTRMVFNTIADFLSDEFRDLASPTWTPLSSPTALFQRTARQPLTPRAPPENTVRYIMISMRSILIIYIYTASLLPMCKKLSRLKSMDAK